MRGMMPFMPPCPYVTLSKSYSSPGRWQGASLPAFSPDAAQTKLFSIIIQLLRNTAAILTWFSDSYSFQCHYIVKEFGIMSDKDKTNKQTKNPPKHCWLGSGNHTKPGPADSLSIWIWEFFNARGRILCSPSAGDGGCSLFPGDNTVTHAAGGGPSGFCCSQKIWLLSKGSAALGPGTKFYRRDLESEQFGGHLRGCK